MTAHAHCSDMYLQSNSADGISKLVIFSFYFIFLLYVFVSDTGSISRWLKAGADPASKFKEGDFSNIW